MPGDLPHADHVARDRIPLPGREAALADLDALAGTTTDRHVLAVVRGAAGIGKSALLAAATQRWLRRGVTVLPLRFRDAVMPWDLFGAGVIVEALRTRTGDISLTEQVNAAAALCAAKTYDSAHDRAHLLARLSAALRRLRGAGPVVVVAEDVDVVPNPVFALMPACLPGYLVVATCQDDRDGAITQAADRLLDLGPLPAEHIATLLAQRLGVPPDDSLLTALGHALGPLAGEPGTLLSIVDELRDRIVPVHGRACLTGAAPVALPAAHPIATRVRQLGEAGRDLVARVAAVSDGLAIDDLPSLAATTGRGVGEYGRAVDTLVAAGVLNCAETGRLTCACPALAETVRATPAAEETRRRDGWFTHYRRLRHGYANGDWADALSAARQLELTAPPDEPARQFGRLLAAEICVGQDDLRQARSWLAAANGTRFVAMRGWVRTGLLAATGDTAGALEAGWQAYCESPAHGDRPRERVRLLTRLALVSAEGGHRESACAAFAAMTGLRRQEISREAFLFVRGVVTEDLESVRASTELARQRGHQPDLLAACLVLGELSDEALPWLAEAHDIAERLGSPHARARARTLMRAHGLATPRGDGDRTELTGTEQRIVDLVRDGRTNRQIAATLQISEKSVEHRLSRLLGRTGHRSRVGLATAGPRGAVSA